MRGGALLIAALLLAACGRSVMEPRWPHYDVTLGHIKGIEAAGAGTVRHVRDAQPVPLRYSLARDGYRLSFQRDLSRKASVLKVSAQDNRSGALLLQAQMPAEHGCVSVEPPKGPVLAFTFAYCGDNQPLRDMYFEFELLAQGGRRLAVERLSYRLRRNGTLYALDQ